ncbi:tubulin delta chain [Labeo rohita]|uniref:Tubulin delta chain n=1 Tax=Labeo rohita TaxID=84645 RepID=A0A498NDT8_LABRO|nr:tubulin delta chain [Labeo rohita]
MSVVSLQLGQCGNQIGHELFSVISDDSNGPNRKKYKQCSDDRFFYETSAGELVARAVLVDMEPKVISQAIAKASKSGRWRYGDKAHFSQKQGSGNNWANGFCVHGPRHEEAVEDLVRKEIERCDRLAGIFTMMSVAGGTGSGVGTYITQRLRDLYPNSFILNQVTWPYGAGEVIVQNYNSVLTLSHLYQLSDAILVHENDTVHKICSRLMNIKHISISDVNKVIAHQLASVLQPAYTADSPCHYSTNPIGELMSSLVSHPEYKLLSLCNIPQMSSTSLAYSVFNWPGLLKHLRQMLIASARMEEAPTSEVPPAAEEQPEQDVLDRDDIVAVKFSVKAPNMPYITEPGHPKCFPLEIGLTLMANKGPSAPEIIKLLDWQEETDHYIMVMERPFPCMDLLSFKQLLFEMVCRDFPIAEDLYMTAANIWTRPGLSQECCELICDCLQPKPKKRLALEKIHLHDWFKVMD